MPSPNTTWVRKDGETVPTGGFEFQVIIYSYKRDILCIPFLTMVDLIRFYNRESIQILM
jgi:hypothetical protein